MKLDQPWLHSPITQKLLRTIAAAGGEARFVGGCVRDAVLGRQLGDFDLATTLKPEAVVAACEAAGCKVVPTGIKHGTVTVILEHHVFEVTTLRRDVHTDGRWAEVEYTDDWQQDAARRDFTMNALFCDAAGEVSDFFGGVEDLKAGKVCFVGIPEQRITEDVLRILRFFRFHAHYGRGAPNAAGLAACRALVSLLPTLSAERVRTELLKLLRAPDPLPTWQLMKEIGVFEILDLPLTNLDHLQKIVSCELAVNRASAVRRLWASIEGVCTDIGSRLRLSNDETARIRKLQLMPDLGEGLYRAAYRHGVQAVIDALVVEGRAKQADIAALEVWQRPHLPLNGGDLARLGVEPGPRMGEVLHSVEEWWIGQDFAPDHAACLEQARLVLLA